MVPVSMLPDVPPDAGTHGKERGRSRQSCSSAADRPTITSKKQPTSFAENATLPITDRFACLFRCCRCDGVDAKRRRRPIRRPRRSRCRPQNLLGAEAGAGTSCQPIIPAKDEVLFRSANLPVYYDQYQDGITRKKPANHPGLVAAGFEVSLVDPLGVLAVRVNREVFAGVHGAARRGDQRDAVFCRSVTEKSGKRRVL